jgi:hypothetical protein
MREGREYSAAGRARSWSVGSQCVAKRRIVAMLRVMIPGVWKMLAGGGSQSVGTKIGEGVGGDEAMRYTPAREDGVGDVLEVVRRAEAKHALRNGRLPDAAPGCSRSV